MVFYVATGTFSEKFSSNFFSMCQFFRTNSKKLSDSEQKHFSRVTKTAFNVSRKTMWENSKIIYEFVFFSIFEPIIFGHWPKNIHKLSKLLVSRVAFWKNYIESLHDFMKSSRTLTSKNTRTWCEKFSARMSKL